MRITIAGHPGSPDVDVEVPQDVRWADLRPDLAAATGRPELAVPAAGSPGVRLSVDDVAVDDDALTGHPPLLPGATVHLGRGVRDQDASALGARWHLAVVTGPDAGALLPLDGPLLVGRARAQPPAGAPSGPKVVAGDGGARGRGGTGGTGGTASGAAAVGARAPSADGARSHRRPRARSRQDARRQGDRPADGGVDAPGWLALDDPAVSGRHVLVDAGPARRGSRSGTPGVRDLRSRNGTALVPAGRARRTRRVRSRRRRLRPGDRLVLGATVLELRGPEEVRRVLAALGGAAAPGRQAGAHAPHDPPSGTGAGAAVSRGAASTWLAGALGGVVFAAVTGNPLLLALALVGPLTAVGGAAVDRMLTRRRRPGPPLRAGVHRTAGRTGRTPGSGAADVSAADLRTAGLVATVAVLAGDPRPADPGSSLPAGLVAGLVASGTFGGQASVSRTRTPPDDHPLATGGRPLLPTEPPAAGSEVWALHRLAPDGCVAVVGPRARALAVARLLVCDALTSEALHGRSVRTEVWPRGGDTGAWSWCRWAEQPSEATDPARTLLLVDGLDGVVPERSRAGRAGGRPRADPVLGRPAALARRRAAGGSSLVVVVVVVDERSRVPTWFGTRVHVDAAGTATVTRADRTADRPSVRPDLSGVSTAWADRQARLCAALRVRPHSAAVAASGDRLGQALPGAVALADLPGVPSPDADAVGQAWARPASPAVGTERGAAEAGPGDLVARLGVGPSGPVLLDLVRDGPHGLVAGTTGAGKSELLQTWVLSLALGCSPADLAVLLVDYKGGAGLGACTALPHVVGQITDLDPALATRALTGLRAELRRRERLLAAWGVPDIASLRARAPHATPPRLLVVVDEFRALVDDLPGFVPGLLRVAAQGRSLGVHLLLATQRPGGAVGPDLRANLALRVCLRVTDTADSLDVLDLPDAARIPAGLAGRALVRRGPGPLEPVQVALADARPSAPVAQVRRATWPEATASDGTGTGPGRTGGGGAGGTGTDPTGMVRAWVAAAVTAARRAGLDSPDVPWLPELPTTVPLSDLPRLAATPMRPSPGLATAPRRSPAAGPPDTADTMDAGLELALADVPAEQRRGVVAWRPWAGALLVVGAPASGRTTTLRTLAAVAAQRGWDVHAVSPGPPGLDPERWPGVGTCVSADDPRLVARLLAVLGRTAAPGTARGRHLLLVDDLDAVLDALAPVGRGRGADRLVELVRDGRRRGVCVAATARSTLPSGLAALFPDRLVLRVGDGLAETMAGVPTDLAGGRRPAGRAVWIPGSAGRSPERPPGRGRSDHEGPAAREVDDLRDVPDHRAATSPDPPPARAVLCQVAVVEPDPAVTAGSVEAARGAAHAGHAGHAGPAGRAGPAGQAGHAEPAEPAGDVGSAAEGVARPGAPRLRPVPHHVRLDELPAASAGEVQLGGVPVGRGGDDAGPVRLRLDRGALVAGPPGSGRSTALTVVAHGLLTAGYGVLVVARDGPLRDLAERRLPEMTCGFGPAEIDAALDVLLRRPADAPAVVIVDDLDALEQADPTVALRLAGVTARDPVGSTTGPSGRAGAADRRSDRGVPRAHATMLVASAQTAAACMSFRGTLGALRAARRGLVLSPLESGGSEVFGVDLSWDGDPARPHDPGRGVALDGRDIVPIQVACPDGGP